MKEVIRNLCVGGAIPLSCCCGHGRYSRTIVMKTRNDGAVEYYSGVTIPRKTRFYIRDNEGKFYIPEVESYISQLSNEAKT